MKHWQDGPLFCFYMDGDRRLGRAAKYNCCNWVIYDSREAIYAQVFGKQIPGMWASLDDAKRRLEQHIEANPE